MSTIMVQIMDRQKTLEALHFAAALAHSRRRKVALVKMVPVQHLGWLGTELGYASFTDGDHKTLLEYRAVAESYGVAVETHAFQYVSLADAIADAADYVAAQVVFAALPHSVIPFQDRFGVWLLRRRLAQQDRQLYLLEPHRRSSQWTPAILVPAVHQPDAHR
jgi:hypothetical protein